MKKFYLLALALFAFVGFASATDIPAYEWKFDPSVAQMVDLSSGNFLKVCASFTDNFIDKYKYEDSTNYRFALNVKVNGIWGWYNTLRNKNNGVSNYVKRNLDGAVSAKEFKTSYCWNIGLLEPHYFATDTYKPGLQFTQKILPLKGKLSLYLSATKELKGWELADISYFIY
jgi:hypothetical protein